ncbi:MAG: hypothetical protein Q8916_07310 [Bacteroidota bacterium]|nr:hypothetical protein [Bacteroidota bacterium]MDP4230199.1 hypothetical protein [Bacteroidota bacterium]MDP4236621.1 hypothetical protein [Bacteroidota bacterium]
MNGLTAFGFAAIIIMLIAYILEDRAPVWIFVFGTACVASSIYGWLAGTIPFGIVEILWAIVAYRKWWKARAKSESFR